MPVKKTIRHLASLKLAVILLLSIGTLVATGTIVESMYNDATTAQQKVYHTWFSYTIFAIFAINLIAVIVDRYPWKSRHISFISAHIGILTLLLGALVTRYFGIDGTMTVKIGESQNSISLPDTEMIVYTSLDGNQFRPLFNDRVEFLKSPPSSAHPYEIQLPKGSIQVIDFYPYALYESKVTPSSSKEDGAAVRFQLAGERATQSQWLVARGEGGEARASMGLAQVILTSKDFKYSGGNILVFKPIDNEELAYSVYSDKQKGLIHSGKIKAGDRFETGWMDFQVRLLKYIPHAKEEISFKKMDRASELTISALKFIYNQKEWWIGLNSSLRLYGDSEMYVLSYGQRRIPADFRCLSANASWVDHLIAFFLRYECLPKGFRLHLKEFNVGRYEGTRRAASYKSIVSVEDEFHRQGGPEFEISMNHPLDYYGLTFYQASFSEDEMGRPTHSVFSVNYDPGRWMKYIGSLLIVFGSIHLFYRRWRKR